MQLLPLQPGMWSHKCLALSRPLHCQQRLVMIAVQPIRVRTSSGQVGTAILHTFEMQTPIPASEAPQAPAAASMASRMTSSDMRVCALHQRSPIQMFMFNSHGALLNANKAALQGLESLAGALSIPYSDLGCVPCIWAAWYITKLLVKSMPKGVVFSFLCSLPALRAQPHSATWYALAYIHFTRVA